MTAKAKASLPINKIPIIYRYLYKKLCERFPRSVDIKITDMISCNRNIVHQIPSKHDYRIINDLIEFGLVRKINSDKCSLVKDKYAKVIEPIEEYWAWP